MTETFEEYEQEYNSQLSKIRSILAGSRTRETLQECDRLLEEAKKSATAMQGLAEVEGNQMKIREASQRVDRDLGPLSKEIKRALNASTPSANREELFYQAPAVDGSNGGGDMESLIASSDSLLRETQSVMIETEQLGNSTILQMGHQRDQLNNANSNIDATMEVARQAGLVLNDLGRRAFRSKLCLYVMIGALGVGNLWAFIRLFKK